MTSENAKKGRKVGRISPSAWLGVGAKVASRWYLVAN